MLKQFQKPGSIEEAVLMKEDKGESLFFLAGGTVLNSRDFTSKPDGFISLEGLSLNKVLTSENEIVIGAMCTAQELLENENVPFPLKEAAKRMTNRNIRNIATIGGNLAGKKSNSDFITVLMSLDAKVEISTSKNWKSISICEYLSDNEDSLITGVKIPINYEKRKFNSTSFSTNSNELPLLTVAISFDVDGNNVLNPVIAVGGVTDKVMRLQKAEESLNGKPLPEKDVIEKIVSEEVFPTSDYKASAEFKKYLSGVLVSTALYDAKNYERE